MSRLTASMAEHVELQLVVMYLICSFQFNLKCPAGIFLLPQSATCSIHETLVEKYNGMVQYEIV
jgi:hypothetical protein